jgi:ATP-binding protein involved in chromosome partitioning
LLRLSHQKNNSGAIHSNTNIKNIIAISSGKGGVGKSSTAINTALAFSIEGARVGILDADIYGPSVPKMLGTDKERPISNDGVHMEPIMAYGIATNSIGYLIEDSEAMVWRGPMASKALIQIMEETLWPELDYLILDMPPGTGDIQLTLAQKFPVTGAVVVTTPQEIALNDARKGIVMFQKVGLPCVGIIENMSIYTCCNCGHNEFIFGRQGANSITQEKEIPLLAQLPLHTTLRKDLDMGYPTVIRQPDSELAMLYRDLAINISNQIYWKGEVMPSHIPFRKI